MVVHVGPWEYWVVIQGTGVSSSFDDRAIYIGEDIAPSRRLEELEHELWHVWEWHVPAPHTEEERATLHATVSAALRRDLHAQGGLRALKELGPKAGYREVRYVPVEEG